MKNYKIEIRDEHGEWWPVAENEWKAETEDEAIADFRRYNPGPLLESPIRAVELPRPDAEPDRQVLILLRVRDASWEGYGVIEVSVPLDDIDWTYADAPKAPGDVNAADFYEMTIAVGNVGERPSDERTIDLD